MVDICQFVESLGDLHDAKITSLAWLADRAEIKMSVEDLFSNFRGLPEYKGPQPTAFLFFGVSKLNIAVDFTTRGLLVFEWLIANTADGYRSEILFSPAGKLEILSSSIVHEAAALP